MTATARMVRPQSIPARVQRRLRALRTRTSHRLGLPSRNPGRVRIDPAFRHPIDARLSATLCALYRARFADAAAREIEAAAELRAHRFNLLGHPVQHGERIAWARDPMSGRDWPRTFSADIPYRGPGRLGDIKLPWELNKHQYFFTLGKASWLTGDSSNAREIVRQIDQWIEDNPQDTGINWISALEAGSRVVSWILAYPFYADIADAAFHARLASSLGQQLLFIEEHLSVGPFANTHLAGEAAALVVGGLFLDCRHRTRWIERGLRILDEEIDRQVTADAAHAERSIAYHRFFLDQYYLTAALLNANARAMSGATLRQVERMTAFLQDVLFSDGTAPDFGDADDARTLWFRQDCPGDYRSLLALGAVLFGRADFKATARHATEEVLWLAGPDGLAAFDAIAPHEPASTSVSHADAGYHVMRGGWDAGAPVLAFDCGPLGFGVAGHGHADALSIQLHAAGYPFLTDSGTYSYNMDYAWRDVFRGTRAHNTVVVDGTDQSEPGDRMSWKTRAQARLHRWVTERSFDLADGAHDGYTRLPDPVTHRRVVCFLKPDVWIVWDAIQAAGPHRLELLLHVPPECGVDVQPGRGETALTAPNGARLGLSFVDESGSAVSPAVLLATDDERGAWFSPEYGRRVPSRALSIARATNGPSSLATSVRLSAAVRPAIAVTDRTLEVRIERDGVLDTLSYAIDGAIRLDAAGQRFDGALLFRRRANGSIREMYAAAFSELALDGFEVSAARAIDQLVLAERRCDIAVQEGLADQIRVRVPDDVRVTINGKPAPLGATASVS